MKDDNRNNPSDPGYPTREEAERDPKLLAENLPLSRPGGERLGEAAWALVAPIFEHGEGRGAEGCVVVSPPVFLSEEEANQILVEELSKRGLNFSEEEVELDDFINPVRSAEDEQERALLAQGEKADPELKKICFGLLTLGALDPQKQVAIKYVTRSNYYRLGGISPESTVESYDCKEVAAYLAGQLREKGKGMIFGVFYDPVARLDLESKPSGIMNKVQAMKASEEHQRLLAEVEQKEKAAAQARAAWEEAMLQPEAESGEPDPLASEHLTALEKEEKNKRLEHQRAISKFNGFRERRLWEKELAGSEESLRSQARDFADWLAGQGVIETAANRK